MQDLQKLLDSIVANTVVVPADKTASKANPIVDCIAEQNYSLFKKLLGTSPGNKNNAANPTDRFLNENKILRNRYRLTIVSTLLASLVDKDLNLALTDKIKSELSKSFEEITHDSAKRLAWESIYHVKHESDRIEDQVYFHIEAYNKKLITELLTTKDLKTLKRKLEKELSLLKSLPHEFDKTTKTEPVNDAGHLNGAYQAIENITDVKLKTKFKRRLNLHKPDPKVEELLQGNPVDLLTWTQLYAGYHHLNAASELQAKLKNDLQFFIKECLKQKLKVDQATNLTLRNTLQNLLFSLSKANELQCDEGIVFSSLDAAIYELKNFKFNDPIETLHSQLVQTKNKINDNQILYLPAKAKAPELEVTAIEKLTPEKHYQLYWHYKKQTSIEPNNALNHLRLAALHLATAAQGSFAPALDRLKITKAPHAMDVTAIADDYYLSSLQKLSPDSIHHDKGKLQQFLLYYGRRYNKTYSDYNERLHDLEKAFAALDACSLKSSIISRFIKGNTDPRFLARVILLLELAGLDPINNKASYPFQVKSDPDFFAFTSNLLNTGLSKTDLIKNLLESRNELITEEKKNLTATKGKYTIKLSKAEYHRPIIFFDNGAEIGRIIMEGNSFYFIGHGAHFDITLTGFETLRHFKFENKNGEIDFDTKIKTKENISISAQTNNFIFNGKVESEKNIAWDISGKLAHPGISYADKGVSIDAGGLNVNNGYLRSGALLNIKTPDSIDFDEANIDGKDITIDANSLSINGESTIGADSICKIDLRNQLQTSANTTISSHLLQVNSKIIKNYSRNIVADTASFNATECFTHYATGRITTHKALQVTGDNFWNSGQIDFGDSFDVRLNKLYVHGVAECEGLVDYFKHKWKSSGSSISGKQMNVLSGAYINICSLESVRNLNLTTLAELNVGLTFSLFKNASSLLAVNIGLDLPNASAAFKDLQSFIRTIQKGNTTEALTGLFSADMAFKAASAARWLLQTLLPKLGKPVNLTWTVLLALMNTPSIIKQVRALHEQHEQGIPIQAHQFYNLMNVAFSSLNQGLSIHSQIANLNTGSSNSTTQVNWFNSVALNLASLFLPMNTQNSVLSANIANFSLTYSNQTQSLLSYSAWNARAAMAISDMFYIAAQNGIDLAYQRAETGNVLINNGTTIAENNLIFVNNFEENGSTQSQTLNVQSDVTHFSSNSKTHADNENVQGRQLCLDGQSESHNLNAKATDSLQTGGSIHTDQASLSAHEIRTFGQLHATTTRLAGDNANLYGDLQTQTLVTNLENKLNLDGSIKAETVYAKSADTINTLGTLDAKQTYYEAKQCNLDGTTTTESFSAEVKDTLNINGQLKSDTVYAKVGGTVNLAGVVQADKVYLAAAHENLTGTLIAKAAGLEANDGIALTGNINVDNLSAKSGTTIVAPGSLNGENGYFEANQVDLTGNAATKNITVDTKTTLNVGGNVTADSVSIKAGEKMNVSGTIAAKQQYYETKTMDVSGSLISTNTETDPSIIFKVQTLNATETSHLSSQNAPIAMVGDALVENGKVDAPAFIVDNKVSADFKGSMKVDNLSVKAGDRITINGEAILKKGVLDSDNVAVHADVTLNVDKEASNTNSDEITPDLYVHANKKATLDGTMHATNATVLVQAKNAVVDSKLDTHVVQVDVKENLELGNQIALDKGIFHAKNIADNANIAFHDLPPGVQDAPNTRVVVAEADDVKMSQDASFSGSGAAVIKAHTGNVTNIDTDDIGLKLDHITSPLDLIESRGIYSNIHAHRSMFVDTLDSVTLDKKLDLNYSLALTAANITIANDVSGTKNLTFSTYFGDVINNGGKVHAAGVLSVDAIGNFVNNRGTVGGNETYVHATNDVSNNVGTIYSTNYTQILSDTGSIYNRADQHTVQGNYGPMQAYESAQIIGGTGADHGGYGLHMEAGRTVVNDASAITSPGGNYIRGTLGISSTARSNRVCSYHKEWSNAWQDKQTTVISTQVQTANIASGNGKNTIICTDGGINSCSTNFSAKDGNFLSAKGNIITAGIIANDICTKNSDTAFGFLTDDSKLTQQYAIPTSIISIANSVIVSLSDVKMENTVVITPGNLSITAKNVTVSAPILNNNYSSSSFDYKIILPDLSSLPGYSSFQDADSAFHATSGIGAAASVSNFAVDSLNIMNSAINAYRSGNISNVLCPSAGINLSYTQQSSSWQSVASNVGIQVGSLNILATDKVKFENGVSVECAGDATIDAREFIQKGAKLKSTSETQTEGVTLSMNIQGRPDVGANVSESHSTQTTHANQHFNVGGTLTTHVKDWKMEAANVNATKWEGEIGSLNIVTKKDSSHGDSASMQASTNGNAGFNVSKSDQTSINEVSGIHVTNDLDEKLHVGSTHLKGGKITSDAKVDFHTDSLTAESVKTHNQSESFGLNGNVQNFAGGNTCPNSIPIVEVNGGDKDYRGEQQATIFGKGGTHIQAGNQQGNLNTSDDNGQVVKKDMDVEVDWKAPLVNPAEVQAIKDNFAWAKQQMQHHPVEQPPAPSNDDKKPMTEAQRRELERQVNLAEDAIKDADSVLKQKVEINVSAINADDIRDPQSSRAKQWNDSVAPNKNWNAVFNRPADYSRDDDLLAPLPLPYKPADPAFAREVTNELSEMNRARLPEVEERYEKAERYRDTVAFLEQLQKDGPTKADSQESTWDELKYVYNNPGLIMGYAYEKAHESVSGVDLNLNVNDLVSSIKNAPFFIEYYVDGLSNRTLSEFTKFTYDPATYVSDLSNNFQDGFQVLTYNPPATLTNIYSNMTYGFRDFWNADTQGKADCLAGLTFDVAPAMLTEGMVGGVLGRSLPGFTKLDVYRQTLADLSIKPGGIGRFGLFGGERLAINASSPSEIAWGYGSLSSRQAKLLETLSNPGRSVQIYKSDINLTDLSALTAHTGDEFALFTLGSRRMVVRGTARGLRIDDELSNKLLSQNWRWSGHTHPGLSDNVLTASGFPGDRHTLNLFNQERSVILNSAGRRNIFDLENDYAITNQASYSTIRPGY